MRVGAGVVLVGAAALAATGDNHGAPVLAGAALGAVLLVRERPAGRVLRVPPWE
jgi:hypothetical protein